MAKGQTISDWTAQKKAPLSVDSLNSNKEEDMRRLQRSDLPQFNSITTSYIYFNTNNEKLTGFFRNYQAQGYTFCVRALPTEEGKKMGYTRKPKLYIPNMREAQNFLENIILHGEKNLWNVGISNMSPNLYGGVIISSQKRILAEIGIKLDKLTAGEETPLATYERERMAQRGKWHRIENKTASEWLRRATNTIGTRMGYFEFIIAERKNKKEIKFVDFKTTPGYFI